jgi:hypothetical protein
MNISSDPIDTHHGTKETEELEVTQQEPFEEQQEPFEEQQKPFEEQQEPFKPQQELPADPILSLFHQDPVEAHQDTITTQEDSLEVQEEQLEDDLIPLNKREPEDDDVLIQESMSVHVLDDSESEKESPQKNQPEILDLIYKEDALDDLND